MSQRNILDKRIARLRKLQRRQLPRYFDLVQWLKDRRYAQTTGAAERLILTGRVRSGSHTIGVYDAKVLGPDGKEETVPTVNRIQPAAYKADLIVLDA